MQTTITLEDVSLHGFPAVPQLDEYGKPITLYPVVHCECCRGLYDYFPLTPGVTDICPFCYSQDDPCNGQMVRTWMTRKHMAKWLGPLN